jgi:hypothetical protein
MTTVQQPQVGAAGLIAALTGLGLSATLTSASGTEFAVFPYTIEVGSHAGQNVHIGLQVPGDWPITPPPGPHMSPPLGHPDGNVHASPLGTDWEYWSRPAQNWPADRSARAYMRHLRALFMKA